MKAIVLLVFVGFVSAGEPALDLPAYKDKLTSYVTSGAYEREIAALLHGLGEQIANEAGKVKKPAIVLDVDETALSNWPEILATSFGYAPCSWDDWVGRKQALALGPVLKLYKAAVDNGVTVFFITGRKTHLCEATSENLKQAGYHTFESLTCKPAGVYKMAAQYKAEARRKIEAQGYTILLNIGDQQSDLSGGFARSSIKLPNPFYTVK